MKSLLYLEYSSTRSSGVVIDFKHTMFACLCGVGTYKLMELLMGTALGVVTYGMNFPYLTDTTNRTFAEQCDAGHQ